MDWDLTFEDKLKTLKSGWKIIPKLHGDPNYAEYVRRMAAELEKRYPRKKAIKPDGMTDEEFNLSLQCQSTKDLLEKHKDPNYKRDWTAPIPENYLANPDAKTKDELVNKRILDIDEVEIYRGLQHSPRNTLGQGELGASQEAKARAIDHFLSHPGIPEQLLTDEELIAVKLQKLSPKGIPASIPHSWKKLSPIQALWHWIKGGKVESVKEDGWWTHE